MLIRIFLNSKFHLLSSKMHQNNLIIVICTSYINTTKNSKVNVLNNTLIKAAGNKQKHFLSKKSTVITMKIKLMILLINIGF
jgi:hypothetical protein